MTKKDKNACEEQKNEKKNITRGGQSMSRLGDGRDFASGVAQNSRTRGRFDASLVMFCLFIRFLLSFLHFF